MMLQMKQLKQVKSIAKSSKAQARTCSKRMKKISIAPGEMGNFKNWKDDIY